MIRILVIILLLALALLIPIFLNNLLWLHLLNRILVFAILGAGVRLILSVGEVSLGHAGFFAVGAYASTLLVMRLHLSYWLSLPLAGIITAIIAAILAYPIMRARGPYFFLITLIVGTLLGLIFAYFKGLFGGTSGITNVPHANPISLAVFNIDFLTKTSNYYLILILFLAEMVVFYRIQTSRIGLTLRAINQSSKLAESLGINVTGYKVLAFTIACFFAGLAGSFYSQYLSYVDPSYSDFWKSVEILVIAIVGGTSLVSAPIVGSITMGILGELARELGTYYDIMLYSVLLFLIVRFMPEGLSGTLDNLLKRYTKRLVA